MLISIDCQEPFVDYPLDIVLEEDIMVPLALFLFGFLLFGGILNPIQITAVLDDLAKYVGNFFVFGAQKPMVTELNDILDFND